MIKMVLNENQKNMYKDCMFLNEGLFRDINQEEADRNRLWQFKNLNSEFDKLVEKLKMKMEKDGYTLVKNFSSIKDDYNQRKVKEKLKPVTKSEVDDRGHICYEYYIPSKEKYKSCDCISVTYNEKTPHPEDYECELRYVYFVFTKNNKKGEEVISIDNAFGIFGFKGPYEKHFSKK